MTSYNTIAENPNSTVVAEYIPVKQNATHYQGEDELECEFIRLLQGMAMSILPSHKTMTFCKTCNLSLQNSTI